MTRIILLVLCISGNILLNAQCISGDCNNGNGTYKFTNGDMYTGGWVSGARTGYGRYDWADGSYYVGNFKDNLLHGEGSYYATDGSTMIGTFQNNELVNSTEDEDYEYEEYEDEEYEDDSSLEEWLAEMEAADKADDEAKKQALSTAQRFDFCTMVQKVADQYPNNFEPLKGPQQHSSLSLGSGWYSNLMMTDAEEAVVSQSMLGGSTTYYSTLYSSDDFTAAKAKYDEYVSLMQNCNPDCCMFVYDVSDFKGDSYESYLTYWFTFMVDEGYSEVYEDMVLEVELMSNIIGPKWSILFRSYEFTDD